jgi:hypothetical protein
VNTLLIVFAVNIAFAIDRRALVDHAAFARALLTVERRHLRAVALLLARSFRIELVRRVVAVA